MKPKIKFQFVLIGTLIIFSIFVLTMNSQSFIQYTTQEDEDDDNGDDDGDDLPKTFGLIALVLFSVVILKALIFFIYKFTRKLPETKESNIAFKTKMKTFFMKTRKPLQFAHYLSGSAAIILLFIHGISLFGKSLPRSINGIITAIILTFYVSTGLITKFKLFKESKKFKKVIMQIHRNFPFFIFITIFHFIHLALED